MSGHSKWATIKHKKAATDAKRGRVFTRVIREITIAARIGGGDPNSNPRLRTAILAGKNENMPNENIERAILRGTGQLEGEQYEEATFEGYGPGGVGMLIQVVTTNRNRIVGEFRHLMSKNGGNMAEAGAVGAITDYLCGLRGGGHRPLVAAMGASSSAEAGAHGWPPDVVAPTPEVGAFVQSVTRFVLENGA